MTTTASRPSTAKKPADRQRPSTARRHTRSTEAAVDDGLDLGFAFTDDDGTRLQVRIRDVKGSHDAALVKACGRDFSGLLAAFEERQGTDLIAALIWFTRLVNGRDDMTYEETLDEVGYTDIIVRGFDEAKAADDAPEA